MTWAGVPRSLREALRRSIRYRAGSNHDATIRKDDPVPSDAFSQSRLQRMHEALARHVERGELPGLVTLVSRHGDIRVDAIGTMDAGGEAPMTRDTIFRVDSITKPLVAAMALTMVEDCTLRLDDPVDPWLPELADRRVLARMDGQLDETVPANRQISLRDLLTLRMGVGYLADPEAGSWPIQQALDANGFLQGATRPQVPPAPDEWMRRLGSLPLSCQPGERWQYDLAFDVLGVLLARAAGQPLEAAMRERLLDPLGMIDTSFTVPASNLNRFPSSYDVDPETGALRVVDDARASEWSTEPAFPAAAGGMVSTADDLLAFGRMLLQGGRLGETRILSRASVATMLTDQIPAAQKAVSPFFPGFWETTGWGFGLGITLAREGIGPTPGSAGWAGGVGPMWRIDPAEDLVMVLLTQLSLGAPAAAGLHNDFGTLVYQALDE
jgi:CubicO group peptidase (beta-lactamase class C family)